MKIKFMKSKSVIFVLIFLNSCNLDIVENYYKDYGNAIEKGFNGNGYFPKEFMLKSIGPIRTILNMDSQESLCKFQINDTCDWDDIINLFTKCDIKYIEPTSFKIPKWWDLEIEKRQLLCFTDEFGRTYPFAIDQKNRTIFVWTTWDRK
jgi:hypothetical protein